MGDVMIEFLQLIENEDDKSKFEKMYTEYRSIMFFVARKILLNDRDAEDAVHNSFLKVINIINKVDNPTCQRTKALLTTIVEREAIDMYRYGRRHSLCELDDEAESISRIDDFQNVELRIDISRAIAELPAKYREVLIQRYDSNLSYKEIAILYEVTEASARKMVQRGKEKLVDVLMNGEKRNG